MKRLNRLHVDLRARTKGLLLRRESEPLHLTKRYRYYLVDRNRPDHRLAVGTLDQMNRCVQAYRTDNELRAMWRAAGGRFTGPNVETGSMPEEALLKFLRSLGAGGL